jgi:hypothetical protein
VGARLGSSACSMPRPGAAAGVQIQRWGHDFGRVQGEALPAPKLSAAAAAMGQETRGG